MPNIKKICVVSLLGKNRVIAFAAYNGESLVVTQMELLTGMFGSWKEKLVSRLKDVTEKGFSVYIESMNADAFHDSAFVLTLDTIDEEIKRTYQNIALDHYFALLKQGDVSGSRQGSVSLRGNLQRHYINSNTVNVKQDEKGRNKYDVEQSGFDGYKRCVLLAVLAAVHFNDLDDSYINTFMGLIGEKRAHTPLDRMFGVVKNKGGIAHGRSS